MTVVVDESLTFDFPSGFEVVQRDKVSRREGLKVVLPACLGTGLVRWPPTADEVGG